MDRSARKSGHRDQRAGTSSSSSHLERAAVKTEVTVKIESKEVSTICRVCLQCGDIPIHGNDSFTDVSQELNAIAGINVQQDDEYPKHLCASCNSQLQGAIQLRTTAQYSEVILLQQNESRVEDAEDWNTLGETDSPTGSSLHEDQHQQAGEIVKKKTNIFQNIKNIFNLKVKRKQEMLASSEKLDGSVLKMEPLTVENKSVSRQEKLSLALGNRFVSNQNKPLNESDIINVKICAAPELEKLDLRKRKSNMDKIMNETKSKIMKFDTLRTDQNSCASKINIPAMSLFDSKLNKQIETLRKVCKLEKSTISAQSKRGTKKVESEDNLFCKRCKIKFENKKEHQKHTKTDGHKNYKEACAICHKVYHYSSLKLHQLVHTREISHICDICGRGFTLKSTLDKHILTHSSFFPVQCDLCPYRGRDKDALRNHMRSHKSEKPYQCSACAYRCSRASNLALHMNKKHTDEYKYNCDTCGKGFHYKPDVEKHIRAEHLGIKDHVCDICGKAFGFRKQMTKHQAKVHNKRRKGTIGGPTPLYMMAEQQGGSTEVDAAFDK